MPSETHAISSDLTGDAAEQIIALWTWLRDRFGLEAARSAGPPHITYVVGEVDEARVGPELAALAQRCAPFEISFEQVSAFSDPYPVVYLKVAHNTALLQMHDAIWRVAMDAGMTPWKNYDTSNWVPHVTLAVRDVERVGLAEAAQEIGGQPRPRASLIKALALVHLGALEGSFRPYTCRAVWPLGVDHAV